MSGRDLTPAGTALIQGRRFGQLLVLELLLDTPLYLCRAAMDVEHEGVTYKGLESLQVKSVSEAAAGEVQRMEFSLPAVPNEYLAMALATPIRGKRVRLKLGLLEPEALQIVQMVPLWAGQLDQMPVRYGQESGQVTVTAEHRAVAFSRIKASRYTDAEQQRLHAGDRSLEFIVSQSQQEDVWPSKEWFRQ